MRISAFFLLLFASLPLFGLYNGNPALPEIIDEGFFFCKENWIAVKAGYERDWVFDRGMKAVSKVSRRIDRFKSLSDQGVLILNIINRIEIYGSVGAMRIEAYHSPRPLLRNKYETQNQLTWGVGGRGLIYQWGQTMLSVDLKYQHAHPTIKWITQNGAPIPLRTNARISYHEWQIGLGVAHQIDIFSPYIVLKYSNAQARFKNLPRMLLGNTTHFRTKNRRKFGLALGCSLSNSSRFSMSIEGRLIDEQALTLAGTIKF